MSRHDAPGEDDDGEIGSVIEADIMNDNIRVKLKIMTEDALIGVPYMVHGEKNDFYCISSNVIYEQNPIAMKLANTLDFNVPIEHSREEAGALEYIQIPAVMDLSCLRVMPRGEHGGMHASGFKMIPRIFSPVRKANQSDIENMVEGMIKPGDTSGSIGHFLGTRYAFPMNLTELFRVPFGIFGKTGFGKTITAKTILIRALSQGVFIDGKLVQFVIFDAQGEYARGIGSSANLGLFQYVPDKLHQLSIDPGSTTSANTTPMYIDPAELTVMDWLNAFWDYTGNMEALLKDMDNARCVEIQNTGPNAHNTDLALYVNQFPDAYGSFPQYTVNAVWRRMQRFIEPVFRRFLMKPPAGHDNVIKTTFQLLRSGKSVIIHFGKYGLDTSVYMFITNYITRKLYEKYSRSIGDPAVNLPHLVLMVEEAHRFIPSSTTGSMSFSGSSYFHKIARETRKFGLTAGFIDQRPSKLDDEVISQLASRVLHRLDDPDDVKSALSGLSKVKWAPIVSKLGNGESMWFGNAVGDIPTMIKPFWSNVIEEVKNFFGLTAVTPDMLARSAMESTIPGDNPEEIVDEPDDTGNPLPARPVPGNRTAVAKPVPAFLPGNKKFFDIEDLDIGDDETGGSDGDDFDDEKEGA